MFVLTLRPNAKLLWKRIPSSIKTENSELSAIWEIGKKLWNRELSAIYSLLKDYEWPNHLKNVMKCIAGLDQSIYKSIYCLFIFYLLIPSILLTTETTRKRALNLISKGFTSISLDEISNYIGLSEEETIETIRTLGWNIDFESRFVTPSKPSNNVEEISSSEEQLAKLTEYVAFLEN